MIPQLVLQKNTLTPPLANFKESHIKSLIKHSEQLYL